MTPQGLRNLRRGAGAQERVKYDVAGPAASQDARLDERWREHSEVRAAVAPDGDRPDAALVAHSCVAHVSAVLGDAAAGEAVALAAAITAHCGAGVLAVALKATGVLIRQPGVAARWLF